MNTTLISARLTVLYAELTALEAQITLPNPPATQEILDDEWTTLTDEVAMLEELLMNAIEDTRGCAQCAGCAYCEESAPGYDYADEI